MPQLQSDPYERYIRKPDDPYEKYLTKPPAIAVDPYAKYIRQPPPTDDDILGEFTPGRTAEFPLQGMHPDLTKYDRFKVMFRGGNPEVGQRYLESQGFQVQPKGGFQYALKRGKGDWYFFDEPGASFQDISDVAGDVLSLGGLFGGAAVGTGAAAATGPGAFAAGVAGAGVGTGLAQGLRIAGGEAMGLPSRAGEIPGEIGEEIVSGAGAQVLGVGAGKLLGMGARGLGRARAGMRAKRQAQRPPAAPVDKTIPAKAEPGATAATTDEMVAAVEALGSKEPAVVEFVRRTKSTRTAQEKGDVRRLEFQKSPNFEAQEFRTATQEARQIFRTVPDAVGHLSIGQLVALTYRRRVHGLSQKGFDEVLRLSKGMPAKEIDELIKTISPRFPFSPAEHKLLGPVVNLEARAAEVQRISAVSGVHQVPVGKAVDFWRFIPIEGIRKLTLPDGKVLQLTRDQAAAAKHVIVDIATHGIPFRVKVGEALTKLGKALQVPRTLLFRGLKAVGMDWIKRFRQLGPMQRLVPRVGQVGAVSMVSPFLAKGLAATYVAGWLGRGAERLGRMMIADTSGGILHSISYTVGMRLSRKIQKVLGFLNRPAMYRLGVYELLEDPEFRAAAEQTIGAPGNERNAGLGSLPGAGSQ